MVLLWAVSTIFLFFYHYGRCEKLPLAEYIPIKLCQSYSQGTSKCMLSTYKLDRRRHDLIMLCDDHLTSRLPLVSLLSINEGVMNLRVVQ